MVKRNPWRDERGVAAMEFALILPILVSLVLLGVQGWMQINQLSQMRSGLQAGARYYQTGGADDPTAAAMTLQAWSNHPDGSSVNATRSCTCGGAGASCSSLCANQALPQAYVTLTATGGFSDMMTGQQSLTQSGTVRVR